MTITRISGNNAYAGMMNSTAPTGPGPVPQTNTEPVSQTRQPEGQSQEAFQVSITPEARAMLATEASYQPTPPPPAETTQNPGARTIIDVVG